MNQQHPLLRAMGEWAIFAVVFGGIIYGHSGLARLHGRRRAWLVLAASVASVLLAFHLRIDNGPVAFLFMAMVFWPVPVYWCYAVKELRHKWGQQEER